MKHLLKGKRKKSPEPPQQSDSSGRPVDIAAAPTLHAKPYGILDDEGGGIGPRITLQGETDADPEFPALGAWTPGFATLDVDYGNRPTTEGTNDIEGDIGRADASRVAKRARRATLPEGEAAKEGFGPLKVVLGAIPALYANREGIVAVNNRIENLLSRIVTLEERFNSRPSDVADQRHRDELIRKLGVIEGQLRLLSEKPGSPRFNDRVRNDEDLFRPLEDLQEAILDYQIAQQTIISDRGFQPMDPVEATVLNNVRYAQQAEYRHGNRNGCLRGTRAEILDKIELWTRDFDKPPVYWLNGLAGTGKSTIAQTIAERTFADGSLGASFFCSRDFDDRSNLRSIFPTLAVQLARRYTQFRSAFIRLVQADPEIVHESLYNQMKKLIVRPLAESAVSTVIVIDALDECKDEEPASAILSVLGQFVTEVRNVKFFITGRPESRIREGFRLPLLAEATDVFVLHEVEPGQVNKDIRLFFTHSFSELRRYRRVPGDWPAEEQVDFLCERAGGLFVYAVATVRFVGHRSNSPKKQLDRLLRSQGSSVFEGKTKFNADATVDSLYMSILQEAFGGDDPEDDPRIRSILGAVVLAANPLSPFAIAALLGFEPEEVYSILSLVHSLLVLQEHINQPVRPFHKSFPDFVVDPARCTDQRFRIFPPDQHVKLLVGCLETMNRELERNMCGLPDGVANSDVINLKERTEERIGQALEYACRSWHKHLVGTMPAHVTSVLHEFLEKKFLFWLEVLSVLGAAREAVDALEATARCEWPNASPTLNLVRDFIRFVLAFFEVIDISAPHIYHSALPLSPRTSITWEMYKKHASPLVRVVQGIPISWERAVATADFDSLSDAVWSPCNRFIAAIKFRSVEVLDAVTLSRLSIFEESSYGGTYSHLSFSPDSRCLTLHIGESLFSWDLQTGGPLRTIPLGVGSLYAKPFSLKHSGDGKVVAIAYKYWNIGSGGYLVYTYNLLSGRRAGPRRVPEGQMIYPIWTHNEDFRFAAIGQRSIRIWQSPFTLEHPPVEIASLPVPDGITYADRFLFLPTLSRLAFVLRDTIQVWDVKAPKLLLKSELTLGSRKTHISEGVDAPCGSFSSDGRFFAYTSMAGEIHVWEESPTGYLLHQRFSSFTTPSPPGPRLSPNGESIITSHNLKIRRWHTRDEALSLPSVSTGDGGYHNFVLGFSPDENFAAFARKKENTVTIIDLQSGELKWNTNMGVKIDCLRMAGGTVMVVGEDLIVTWNLPGGDCTLNATIDNAIRSTTLDHPSLSHDLGMPCHYMSIFPDLSRIVVARISIPIGGAPVCSLEVDDVSTGSCLAFIRTPNLLKPQFAQDGREVWAGIDGFSGEGDQCEIIEDREFGTVELKLQRSHRQRGILRESSCGYAVTDSWWVLSPARKRLLWLPHRWRSDKWKRVWGGRFLGLLHSELSEVVVLEFFE